MGKAAIYVRVSRKIQEISPEAQRQMCVAYAKQHGHEVIEEITDMESAFRGKNMASRIGGRKLIALIESKAIDTILAVRLDRMFRSVGGFLCFSEYCQKKDVRIFLTASDTEVESKTSEGFLTSSLFSMLAEFESLQKSERIRAVKDHQRKNGLVYSAVPYGFTRKPVANEEEESDKLAIDPEQYHILQEILRLADDGMSSREIATWLNINGKDTPTVVSGRKHCCGKTLRAGWTHQTVWKIIKTRQARERLAQATAGH